MRILCNCYFTVSVSFLLSFVLFAIKWSGIYPEVSESLSIFIIGSCLFLFFIGAVLNPVIRGWFNSSNSNILNEYKTFKYSIKPLVSVVVFFCVEVAYNRKIPLIEMLLGHQYDYRDFTFPGIHVFFTSLTTFYCIKSFFDYLCFGSKKSLLSSLVCIWIFILLMYRSYIVFCVLNFIFMFILYKRISIKKIFKLTGIALAIMYFFGLAGDLRTQAQIGDQSFTVSNIIRATDADTIFAKQQVLSPLYWAYLYASSPMANFQSTINYYARYSDNNGIEKFVVYEVLPDVIGKRIAILFGLDEEYSPLNRIIDFLTVGTIFSDSFVFIGWLGPLILLFFMCMTPLLFLALCPKDSIYYVQFSVCTILLVLCCFTNMLVYASLSLILLYPLVFSWCKFKKNGKIG
ncbi:O-antigen polymerase [Escherichia albertii]|uniref:O-antigen polymerase n=1 Tax=Escherichia albertii TaxID=208962 RepID=UPI0016B2144F|nr:O-antigen polymerase [Escherichia albertii]MCQ8909756.1 oligosaccharide repeat unit polymerase [Escherichia albertii]MCQ8958668.1 oligosaccharide repeat unit polymerase [Escherichia albertii]MCQ8990298.1 oligosaccharide repeat unit polymerase [Escherichia albertii]UUL29301.1 oligosaccharide repeat unit polymerase [Escherichia albertii]UUL47557.1 oligosaccharide repeat unit polymerase [Escherichia albertii]